MNQADLFPALRLLEFQTVTYQSQQMWLLRDPLRLSAEQLIFPPAMAQLLMFVDGTRTPAQIQADFSASIGQSVEMEIITDALALLDEAYLLNNQRFLEAQQNLLTTYRSQSVRAPAFARLSYPGDPAELTTQFERYQQRPVLSELDRSTPQSWDTWLGRGIIAPHIDFQRGGGVYARVWQRARAALLDADLVLVFGTDHKGSANSVTLTQLPFATPYGILPTDTDLVDTLAAAIGSEQAYAEELHHRDEHSIEFSAVWLHHIYHQAGVAPKPMVPILIGSFYRFVQNGMNPADDARVSAVIDTLQRATVGKKVVAVASVDMAHVGPAFGDNYMMDSLRRDALQASDDALMNAASQGDAAVWYNQIATIDDRNRICGFSPVYYLLRYLNQSRGHAIAYDQCSADAEDTSLVSIGGMLLD